MSRRQRKASTLSGLRGARRGGSLLALVAVSVLLTGCGAGQQAQTATEQPTNDETAANVGSLALRDIEIATPKAGRYARGEDARLQLVIVNTDPEVPDALVEVRTSAAERVTVTPAAPASTPSRKRPALRPAADPGGQVQIPPDSAVSFRGSRPAVTLVGLTQPMWPSQVVQVTFVFARAGAVTAPVAVAVPNTPVPPAPTAEPSTIPGAGPT